MRRSRPQGSPSRLLPRLAAAFLALLSSLAPARSGAQPVSIQLHNDVPVGTRPAVVVTATRRVRDLRLSLRTDEGTTFEASHPGLARGQKATLAVGDGRPGKVAWTGTLGLEIVGEGGWSADLSFETVVRAPMSVHFDLEHLDLDGHVLRFQMSRPAGTATLSVLGEDGQEIGDGLVDFHGEPPGTWVAVPWEPKQGHAADRVLKLLLKATSADHVTVEADLIPWQVTIDHEEVGFDTDRADIKPTEAGKLDASLSRITDAAGRAGRFIAVKLYVAGHTDTVGTADHNRQLSLARAQAIAAYFRAKGLSIPIAYAGFGEDALLVETPDGTDEARNRRVDYVLGGANGQPPFPVRYRAASVGWRSVR